MFAPPPSILSETITDQFTILLFLFFLLSQFGIGLFLGNKVALDLIQIQLFSYFDPNVFREIVGKWTAEDKARFQYHFILDHHVHPVLYGTFFVSWVTGETTKNRRSPLPYFLFVALIILGSLCDIWENDLAWKILQNKFQASDDEIRMGGMYSLVKWVITGLTLVYCTFSFFTRKGEKPKSKDE